tara:strand:- start:52 stop:192 length:141 start_codon:yes stop_codon:yes gene_type:complete
MAYSAMRWQERSCLDLQGVKVMVSVVVCKKPKVMNQSVQTAKLETP